MAMTRELLTQIELEEFGNLEAEKPQALSASEVKQIAGQTYDALQKAGFLEIVKQENAPGAWSPRMVFDIALGVEDDDVIMSRYGLDAAEYDHILLQPAFRKDLAVVGKELRETGVTFTTKAKLIAEETLQDMFELITSVNVAAKDRIAAWYKVAEFGGLAPKVEKNDATNQNSVNIQINL